MELVYYIASTCCAFTVIIGSQFISTRKLSLTGFTGCMLDYSRITRCILLGCRLTQIFFNNPISLLRLPCKPMRFTCCWPIALRTICPGCFQPPLVPQLPPSLSLHDSNHQRLQLNGFFLSRYQLTHITSSARSEWVYLDST
ncbi:hypothetical protein M378DRAFT_808107 [Amanita muscaria Koide BX008]|uniref:Uncharacterized protein n=1 Tax=Amanita muscaria (strain Koide BX008) TaxID=946122 RepID=A0A0C2SG45_AMAMK|nr:hypothetical protein M378DRAFT_808107 [Amanita muscaria Koide BX008]